MRSHVICCLVALLAPAIDAKLTFPALIFSSKLIPGLRPSLPHNEQLPFTLDEVNQVADRTLEQCTSDAYILVDAPGVRIQDFGYFQGFEYLRNYMSQASTVVTFPNVLVEEEGDLLNYDRLQKLLKVHCNVVTHEVKHGSEDEVPHYIDTKKRLIRIHLDPLTDEMSLEQRLVVLAQHDLLLKKIIRKLPSPYITVLFSGSTPRAYTDHVSLSSIYHFEDIPNDPRDLSSEERESVRSSPFMIFPDITIFDKSRYLEFERNDHGERLNPLSRNAAAHPDGVWAKDVGALEDSETLVDDTWLSKKTKEIKKDKSLYRFSEQESSYPSVIDRDFIVDNWLLVVVAVLTLLLLVFIDIIRALVSTARRLVWTRNVTKHKKTN